MDRLPVALALDHQLAPLVERDLLSAPLAHHPAVFQVQARQARRSGCLYPDPLAARAPAAQRLERREVAQPATPGDREPVMSRAA